MSVHAADTPAAQTAPETAHWGGVYAMTLCVFTLIASEFMPMSILTPIATDLGVTEGQAGQAIAISGLFAVITSLTIARLAGGMDRKRLLLGLTVIMALSGVLVAFAPSYPLFMLGRALIGVVIGGFWSMSVAVAIRLVPADQVTKALAIFNAGNALATVIAAPLGSFLGAVIGWRGAFFTVVPVALIVLVWQWFSLPALKPDTAPNADTGAAAGGAPSSLSGLLRQPLVALGMASVGLFFMGQFALFTYVRPFLENVTRVDIGTLSLILLAIGIAGFIGTSLIGTVLKSGLYRVLILIPLLMAAVAMALIGFGGVVWIAAGLLTLWGFVATAAPVGWWSWLAHSLPRDAEDGGGLMVAVIQLAITLGATAGGLLFDAGGHSSAFAASAVILVAAAAGAALTARIARG
ncbi:MAG: MFS transporter [Paracoccus sp. (in: a-proteobacteria)]|uniref:MFS transporter n=2 Tax=Paracoccus sp. TaxID=267 RepID=UPI0026DEE39B|nr:MFS transporter [Paracoccus sp. (in: a-proteobacteria)]MDO5614079.1 MFS transporter [Paracoccus sp. (in: a-proteobacteria)]